MRIPKKYFQVVMATLMAFFMGGCMSGIVTFINVGAVDDFLFRWGNAFLVVFLISQPLTLVFMPVTSILAKKITK